MKILILLASYLISITILTAVAFVGATYANEPKTALLLATATVFLNIASFAFGLGAIKTVKNVPGK